MVYDWATSYKFFLLLTVIFHPQECVRKYGFYASVALFIFGVMKEYYSSWVWVISDELSIKNNWFLLSSVCELFMIISCLRLLSSGWQRTVIATQGLVFLLLNLHQYLGWYKGDIFYDSFLSTSDYIYWNKWGFEVILLMLWMKEEVFSAIRARWTVNNVIMIYVVGWIVYLAGNY